MRRYPTSGEGLRQILVGEEKQGRGTAGFYWDWKTIGFGVRSFGEDPQPASGLIPLS